MKKFVIIFVVAAIFPVFNTFPQVRVAKTADERNPSVLFKGVSGNSELSSQIGSDLKNCGWFEVLGGGAAEYSIWGSANSSTVQMNVTGADGSGQFSFNMPVQGDIRRTSHRVVDYILKKMFNIEGICSTKIAFSGETSRGIKEVFMCDFDGQNVVKFTANNSLSVEPDWIPGRFAIVYTLYSKLSTDIVEYDISSRRSRRLVQFPGLNACGALSPNGKTIALILSKDRQVDLYAKSLEGTAAQRLTNNKSAEASPCWSPGGDRICFVSDMPGRPNLYIISPAGGSPARLQTLGSESASPAWSKDNKIAYSAKFGRNYTIAVLDLSGKEPSRIVVNAGGDWEGPSWAPDNRHVVCSRTLNGVSTLHIVDTTTGKIKQIPGARMNMTFPVWSGLFK